MHIPVRTTHDNFPFLARNLASDSLTHFCVSPCCQQCHNDYWFSTEMFNFHFSITGGAITETFCEDVKQSYAEPTFRWPAEHRW